ncbi:MAG TPA: DUF5977 domain-containing protein [Chitinophagaceae bacterium]|jgi:hypothetical protein|nr:DUF5977 domain-containing protein [Chitinophagaceae bacterium]
MKIDFMIKRLTVFLFACCLVTKAETQVNLQTGSATFSLPIFDWQDNKSRLKSIVALSYNSGNGLKVNDVSSDVGQGWSLVAGGQIVRMQAGEPDDQVARAGGDDDIKRYPPGRLFATVPAANGCPNALLKYPVLQWANIFYAQHNFVAEDRQLDYFSFQFNGKAGMFILDPDSVSGNTGLARSLGDSKMIINFTLDAGLISQGIRTKITSFTIRDVDGLIYKFALHGLTKILRTKYCDEFYNSSQTIPKFDNGKTYYRGGFDDGTFVNPWIIGSWQLTEIEDAINHRKILLNYALRDVDASAGESISFNDADKDYCVVSKSRSITKTKAISSIVYPDGHTVTVNYGNDRIDLNGEKVVSSIDVSYNSRYLSRHELNTTYFILNRFGTPVTNYEKRVARLCLQSVRKIGVDLKEDTPPYLFDYYTGSSADDDFVPPPFFHAKDNWGFYNGDNSKGFWLEGIPLNVPLNTIKNNNLLKGLCFMRNGVSGPALTVKSGYARNGLLKQIVYPTGGTLSYQYEQNAGVVNGSTNNVGGVHVLSTSATDGGFSNSCANAITTNYNYVINGPGSASSLWGLEMPSHSLTTLNHYQPENKNWHLTWSSLPFGECFWQFKHPGLTAHQQAVSLTDAQRFMESAAPVLGILSVLGTINDISTAINGSPAGLIINVVIGLANLALTCIGDGVRESSVTTYFNSDLKAMAPLPAQFKRVEVVESPGTIGKTVQEFTSSSDYAIWDATNPVNSPKQRFAPWAYGLPKNTIVYDANGYIVKSTANSYSFGESMGGIEGPGGPFKEKMALNKKSCNCEVVKSYSQRNTNWSDPTYHNPGYQTSSVADMKVDIYDMYTGRVELKSTSEKVYKPSSSTEYLETVTDYEYNSGLNFEVKKIKTTQSNGDIFEKTLKYSSDYFWIDPYNMFAQYNMIALPVATVTKVMPNGSSTFKFLSEKVSDYSYMANGDILPVSVLEQRFATPQTSLIEYLATGPWSRYKTVQTIQYDNANLVIGVGDEGGRTIVNIYDYDDKYIVGSVINATTADKSAYSSFETSGLGNWQIGGTAAYVSNSGVTGNRSFAMSSGKSLAVTSLNAAKAYTVSFWSTTSGITVTGGATLTKSAPSINGFTYYEYAIAQGTTSVTVAGTGTLDELRLHPQMARMRTTTYDELIGKTASCDENNRITYYEYDNLGRLRFIKDENRNIVKMHEYNNVSAIKQNGCPGSYTNFKISEVFTRNNCGVGYQGDTATYTVAANTYTSTVSQMDADLQAQQALLTNGQNYANSNAVCYLIYYNALLSVTDTTQNCPPGYVGGAVTYTVPAGTYSSIVSQVDANTKAQDDVDANATAYFNDPAHAVCTYSTAPNWVWLEGSGTLCQLVSGVLHLFILQTDTNPNSSSYGNTRWYDIGPSSTCLYYNTSQSQSFTRNNCSSGYIGSTVTYTVPANTYNSATSQAAADQLATDDMTANGQNYANTNGTCTLAGCGTCTGNDKKCINNICETGTWAVVSSVYKKVIVDGNYAFRWVCTYRYCFSDGTQSTYYEETYNMSSCTINCYVI